MPAKKNYGATRRAHREGGRATERAAERAIAMRMVSPLSAASRSDAPARGAALARAEVAPEASATQLPLPLPLRDHAQRALTDYFASLEGHRPAHLYDLVIREVEEPLFRAVLEHCDGNQSRAATMLGIHRGTLRKKLRELGLAS